MGVVYCYWRSSAFVFPILGTAISTFNLIGIKNICSIICSIKTGDEGSIYCKTGDEGSIYAGIWDEGLQ